MVEIDTRATLEAAGQKYEIHRLDAIADIALQQVLTRPDEFDVLATTNLRAAAARTGSCSATGWRSAGTRPRAPGKRLFSVLCQGFRNLNFHWPK